MAQLEFRAHCARQHDRIDFTDRAAFEQHMTGEHRARRLTPGGAGGHSPSLWGRSTLPSAPGWSGGKPSKPYPWKGAGATPGGLERVAQRIAAGEYEWPGPVHWFPAGPRQGKGTPAAEVA